MAVSHGFNLTEATTSVSAPVQVSSGLQIIVGTAPVNQLANPAAAVNTPLYVSTYKEAVAAVGWSSDFAKYTLCEAISANFQVVGTAPIVVINVLDPKNKKHITALDETSVQVNDGVAEIDKVGMRRICAGRHELFQHPGHPDNGRRSKAKRYQFQRTEPHLHLEKDQREENCGNDCRAVWIGLRVRR